MTYRFSPNIWVSVLLPAAMSLSSIALHAQIPGPKATKNEVNPAVMPVNSKAAGASYEDWAARWWQWELSMPVTLNPIFDTADCSAGQTGQVWFLGGGSVANFFPAPGIKEVKQTRTCYMPQGKFLFFPLINTECSTVPGDNAGDTTDEGLRVCAVGARSTIKASTLSVTLDGVSINNLTQYLVTSPLFNTGRLPDKNVFQFFGLDAPQKSSANSVSDGIHLMLHPLSQGPHTLYFHSEFDFGGGSGFIQDITYNLYVLP